MFDDLNRSRFLEILEVYGVVPQAFRILRTYWRRLTMVARVGVITGRSSRGVGE